jgi:hypothetical protein
MTVRVVSLHSREASDATVGGTAAERLALVTELSERCWLLTGQAFPSYTRGTMPAMVRALPMAPRRD